MNKKNFVLKHKKTISVCLRLINKLNPYNKFSIKRQKNNILKYNCTLLKNCRIKIRGRNNQIIIGDLSRLFYCNIIIYGNNNTIFIGENCTLKNVEICMEDNNNKICIGKKTAFFGTAHLAAIESTKIMIGDNCLLSSELHFRTGDSHSITNMDGKRINPSEDILIGNNVWIGTKVTCLKGVVVADHCVVGATSTLCKKFTEPNCIIAGVPAKVVKIDINWLGNRI